MDRDIPQFGSLCISRKQDSSAVELSRSRDELVFLAFDTRIKRLVELHILNNGEPMEAAAKRSAFDRARQASEIRMPSLLRVLEVGEDKGLVYYTSNLNDGEYVQDYVSRRGALSPSTAFALLFQLIDDVLQLKARHPRLLSRICLNQLLVSTLEDTFLQLRVVDYGLTRADAGALDASRLVAQLCDVMFLMLTGQVYRGDSPDRFPILTQLPTSLRTTLRAALMDPQNAPASLEKLRDEVREAFTALTSSSQGRNLRKHLVVIGPLQPQSNLQDLLLENVPVQTIFGNRFRVEDMDNARRYPFSIPAINAKTEQLITVHMLPPARIVDKSMYEAVPLQIWRFNAGRHPNILRSLSLWESPDWTFLTEEREPGFTLSRLMAERVALNANELVVLMRQVRSSLEQAVECGVPRVDLHPSNIVLRVGKHGGTMAREAERLMQKRLDAWPPFTVKIRPHMTMRSLYEPLLVDFDADAAETEEHLRDRDFRHRSFVVLAAYLLAGERQMGGKLQFGESVPEATAAFVREAWEQAQTDGKAISPMEFMDRFEVTLSAPVVDLATRLRGESVPVEQMESVGAISDFDEDWQDASDDEKGPSAKKPSKSAEFRPYGKSDGIPWVVWAAAAVVILAFGAWFWLDRGPSAAPEISASSPKTEGPSAPVKPVEAIPSNSESQIASKNASSLETVPEKPTAAPPIPVKTPTPPVVIAANKPAEKPPEPASKPVAPTPANKPAAVPPAEKDPVTIRKAILPTPEELEKMKQGHVQRKVGQLPDQNTASPLVQARN
jgi:8-oxo-dGTP pyrophosphatase MutT (NUDIX family)